MGSHLAFALSALFALQQTTCALPNNQHRLEGRAYSRPCTAATFPKPNILGAQILSVNAMTVMNSTGLGVDIPGLSIVNRTNYCQVNVTYTHPGVGDSLTVQTLLPLEGWNGRFVGIGGGGFTAGALSIFSDQFMNAGYACAFTDGGLPSQDGGDPKNWALKSANNVDYQRLIDFAWKSLDELPKIGKQMVQDYYGKPPSKSYWRGCSTGGRQGLISAQRFPENYDGILAEAPAAYWTQLLPTLFSPTAVMNDEGYYPEACELDAITQFGIDACDGLDGVKDGIVSAPDLCKFDPRSVVGKSFTCGATNKTVTAKGAAVVSRIWHGVTKKDGSFLWYPYNVGADLTQTAHTTQYLNGTRGAVPNGLGEEWLQWFVLKDPNVNLATAKYPEFEDLFYRSVQEYDSIIGTSDADLSKFKAAGGKMITWHGTQDPLIPPGSSIHYWSSVNATVPQTDDFYRLFLGPGNGHCGPKLTNPLATGYYPATVFQQLVDWVEKGIAPTQLLGTDLLQRTQPLCQWPLVARYTGKGNSSSAASFTCAKSY
ncbi:tannase and feruloyl esterase, partial [Zopfia rhizophila CBS 207.26]